MRLLAPALTVILTSCLSACALNNPPLIINDACPTFSTPITALAGRPALPMLYHSTDNPDTKTQAQAVNRAYRSLCPPTK